MTATWRTVKLDPNIGAVSEADVLVFDPVNKVWTKGGTLGTAAAKDTGTGDSDVPTNTDAKTLYASTSTSRVQARANGIKFDGTDESTTFQSLVNVAATFGVGVIELDGVVRCDSQITIPATVGADGKLHMTPLRITGTVTDASGSWAHPAHPETPSTVAAGLDLRYAGRSDAGCTTTVGSTFIGNAAAVASDQGNMVTGPGITGWCWILGVDPGVGWIVSAAARATGTVTLASFGGRIQGFGYGRLEVDHLQFFNGGAASSAPFGVTTGPSVDLHDCTFYGASTKANQTCDEDPWVFGGPGSGSYLTSALTAGAAVTSVPVAALPVAVPNGQPVTLAYGTSGAVTVTLAAAAAAGATAITIQSFTPAATLPVHTSVYIGQSVDQSEQHAFAMPSAPFQGYASYVRHNHFQRCRRIAFGLFASSVHVDDNQFMHDCGSNLASAASTLTAQVTSGTAYTSLTVSPLSAPVLAGDTVQIGVGTVSVEATASAAAAVGATSISVNSFTPAHTYPAGTYVFDSTAWLGAAVESWADATQANSISVRENRFEMIGYTHATRFAGTTIHSWIAGNDLQDTRNGVMIAGHRFDRGAKFNTVVQGLASISSPRGYIDDWAVTPFQPSQYVAGTQQPSAPMLTAGVVAINSLPEFSAALKWQSVGVDSWWMYQPPGSNLYIRDQVNGVMALRLIPGSGTGGQARFSGAVIAGSWVQSQAVATAARPAASSAGAGAMMFDSTLGKPIWSNGTAWVDATGATV